ncbi:hypothetical protein BDV18DRAFT_134262 [Aspergillus unguis]
MNTSDWAAAAYGRACASCVQAKCKCVVAESGAGCARCRRLNRECVPAKRVRKMNPARKSAAAKTAQLEKRLDELTSLITSQAGQMATSATGTSPSDSGLGGSSQTTSQLGSTHTPLSTSRQISNDSGAPDQEVLDEFRTKRLPYLPFTFIPAGTSAAQMKVEYPFLWRAMVTLHCKDTVRRAALHEELKATAAKALMVDCQRSLDLLLGLITYLAWIGFECQPRKVSLGPYMQMATGLVIDLALNRPPPKAPDIPGAQFIKTGSSWCRPWISLVRTNEERRAVLGCFLVCSAVSHTLGRTDSMGFTPHMQECLEILAESHEAPTDSLLVQLVRSQLVVDKVTKDLGYGMDEASSSDYRQAPVAFYLKGLQSEIKDIRNHIPSDCFQKDVILLHLYHSETTIYESALSKPTPDHVDLTRLEQLYACLTAVRNRFDVLLRLPPVAFALQPSTILFPTAHSIITLLRLSTIECPGWDVVAVRQTADLISITQSVIDKFASAADAIGIINPPDSELADAFTLASRIMIGLRAGWMVRLPDLNVPPANEELPADPVPALQEIDQQLVDDWLSSQNLAWLAEYPTAASAWG